MTIIESVSRVSAMCQAQISNFAALADVNLRGPKVPVIISGSSEHNLISTVKSFPPKAYKVQCLASSPSQPQWRLEDST